MIGRLLSSLLIAGATGCTPSKLRPVEVVPNNEPSEVYSEIFEPAYQDYLAARTGAAQFDTVAARRALAGFRRASELDPYQHDPITLAADLYLAFGLPDSAVVAMERAYTFDPGAGEMIGYVRYGQGRKDEARAWFRRTLHAVEASREAGETDSLSGFDRESFEAGRVRLLWLAEGNAAASRALAALSDSVRQSVQVRYAECLIETVSVPEYVATTGFSVREARGDYRPRDEAAESCALLLFE